MIYLSDSTSLYLFSALLQANAALFALLGVFIVFRMQSHKSSIDIIKSTLYSDRGEHSTPSRVASFESMKYNEKKNFFSRMDSSDYYYRLYETWVYHLDRNNELKKYITIPSLFLTSGMLLDVIMLAFASNLHIYHPLIEVLLLYVMSLYHIFIYSKITYDLIKVVRVG